MNPPPVLNPPARRPRRLWRWVLGFFAVSAVALAATAYSVLTLSREAATLRHAMLAAVEARTSTRLQLSVGPVPLALVRTALRLAPLPPEARSGLQAVRQASVGIYELEGDKAGVPSADWLTKADRAMARRGYQRIVGVKEHAQTVLIYTPEVSDEDELDVCVAVLERGQLVVVSARVASEPLMELIARHCPPATKTATRLPGTAAERM